MALRRIEDIVDALETYHPDPNLDFVRRAYVYSAKVHAGQVRKSGEPYLIHPLEVAYLLTQLRLDEASVVTGLLHDTVEDTLVTLKDIEELFGSAVATLVDGVTKLSQIHFDTDEHKQAENFRKMLVAMAKDIRVILVKLCDRLHNMRTLEHLPANKQRRIAQETMDIYAPLANRLGVGWIKSELEDLSFRYLQANEYQDLKQRLSALTQERELYVRDVIEIIKQELAKQQITCHVEGRPKHLFGIYKKMISRKIEFEEVYDIIAFRIIVDTVARCYEVLGHIHSIWHPIPGRFKDYIAMPKPNQYQSLHTSVIGPKGERIEIQIRTEHMHRVAEAGIAAHWEYKEQKHLSTSHKQQFAWLRQLMEWQQDLKDPNEFMDTVKYDLFVDEVFVFTPRGQVVALKRGSTPVDFAFAIHSEVGLKCCGAKINGRMVALRYVLKDGDIVEIITNAQQRPSKDWLSFVVTGRAKSKIRALVQQEERQRSLELGRELFERELRKHHVNLNRLQKESAFQKYLNDQRYRTLDALLISIGYGKITSTQIIDKLGLAKEPAMKGPVSSAASSVASSVAAIGDWVQRTTSTSIPAGGKKAADGVLVQGLEDILVRYARCCSPLPGNPITGFITRGRGITIHMMGCSRAIDTDPARRIEVSWDPGGTYSRRIMLRILSTDRPGILAMISKVFADHGINISQATCKVTEDNRAINTFEVMIKDAEQLRKVIDQIQAISGILSVEKT